VRESTDVPGPGDEQEERLRMLRDAGWTAVGVPRGASLTDLWQQADRERNGITATGLGEGWA
jgi:hypothetical protein